MRTRNLKRLLSLVLCLCMVTGLLPVTALAADAPAITTESLAEATVGEEYTAQLAATASDQNGALTWQAESLPEWLALLNNGDGTATLDGTPTEAGEVTFTVTVTETIPAVEPEKPAEEPAAGEPAEGTKPDQGTSPAEGTEPDQGTDPAEGTDPDQGTGPAEGTDPDQGTGPAEGTDPDQGTAPAEGTEPTEGTDPIEGNEPTEGTDPIEGNEPTEGTDPNQGAEPNQGTDPAEPTVLTDTKTYTLTVAEAVRAEPEPEPGITNGITPLAVTNKVPLDFNLYLQPADGGSLDLDRDKITWFSAGNRLYLRMNNYPGTNPTKIALISSILNVENLDETNLDDNAMVLAVGDGNGSMTVSDRILMVTNFQPIDSTGEAPARLADGSRYRFLIWDGADGGDQTVYYSSETYTYTADNAIPMTVTKGGQSVTSFANTDTITITATLPTAPTSVTSVFFVDSQYATSETYMYLEDGSVTPSGNTVTITMNGLFSEDLGGNQDELLVPGTYNIILYDDSSAGEIKYVSTASYTVTGEGGTGNNTCSVSFATDPNFENPVTSVTPSSTEYYVRATDFSPALPYGSQYGVMIKATGSSAVYTLTGTPSFVQDPSGNTAYLQRGPIEFQLGGQSTEPAAGTYDLTVSVYENAGMTGEPLYTYTSTDQMVVTEATVSTPTINTNSPLPGGVTGTAYSQPLKADPGTAGKAITWSISANKPDWLNINANTGVLTGTPTAAGNYTFTVTAAEQDGGEASKSFTIAVTQAITSAGLTVTGGSYSPGDSISVNWNMSGALPGSATADLTLYYTDTSGKEQTATYRMTRYYNYFYAYVELPESCASVEKLSASATISGQTVTGENEDPGITMKGKLSLTWDSLSTSGTLTIQDSSGETVANRSLSKNSTGLELSLPEGEYTLSATAYVSRLGYQPLLEDKRVTVNAGATTPQSLSFRTLQAVTYTPKVTLPNGDSTSSYTLYWYDDDQRSNLLATGKSYTALSTDTLYVRAMPTYSVSATHNESTLTPVTSDNENPTLTLPAKLADTVTVTVQCEDVTDGTATLDKVSGYVVLSQPGADGYKKTTQKRVYNAGAVTFEGVTAGSTITFTPDQKYACGPESATISSVTGGSQTITLKAEALKGVISSNITLLYADRTMNLTFTTMSNLKVKKGNADIPFHRVGNNYLVLDDLNGLSAGTQLTISGQYGSGDFPTAVFEETVTLKGEDLSATAAITMTARGTARISVQNQSRVAADLLLYQDDKLFYTKDSFIASYVSTSDYAYKSGWSPRLPAGSYTVYVVNRDYLRTVNPTTYQTKSAIQFEEGTYTSASFAIRDNETTSVTLNVPDVVQAYADVNFEMSSVTMSVDFPGTFTHTTVITLTGDEQLNENVPITLYLYHDQSLTAAALQSLTINGIPYKNVLESRHDHVFLQLSSDELQKLYGGFPLRVSYVMARYDYSSLEGRSYMTYTNDRGESRSVKVGAFYQETDDVTLNVPSMVNDRTFTVSGYVPQRGKDVTVYLDGAAVATVQSGWRADVSGKVISTTNGYFAAQVTLPEDVEEFDAFRVSAFCEGAMSEEAEVMYTETSGLLTEVRFYPGRIGNKDEYTVWKLGDSPSEGQRYRASNMSSWLRWELDFANAGKVKNVVVHVPRSDGSVEEVRANRITTSGREHTFQTIPALIYGASPTGVYVTYETELVPRANTKTSVSAEDFADGIAALNTSGIISGMAGNQNSLTFTLKNPDGKEDIPVTVESKTEDWGENESAIRAELASFDALKEKPEYSTLPSYVLYYDEGYLDIYENDNQEGGYWGSDRICKYSKADGGTIYQREIYTMSERIIITWDVEARTVTTQRITLGESGAQPDEEKVTSESKYVQAYQRTAQVEQLWMLFYEQLSAAYENIGTVNTNSNTRTLNFAASKGGKLSLKVKIDINKLQEQANALAEDSETWAEGQEITAAEIRQIKDFLDDNPGLVDLYKMHQSTGGDNPYQVVGDARATYYERGMGLIEKALSLATGKPKDVVDAIKDYAIDTVKGKIFYRQSQAMTCDLYTAARLAERTETGVGGMLQGGINWSRFPTNLYDPNSNFSAGHNRQTLPNSPSYTFDPSGYVYEAVPSNRVEGARVDLYTFNESAKVEEWVDSDLYGIEPNHQTTGEDGRYAWFVPEGYWRVVVTKDGYEPVDTGDDQSYGTDATNRLNLDGDETAYYTASQYWMPVLPIQLDVNIPLVSREAPKVTKVEATTEGVYVTFSKYMETTLDADAFKINGVAPAKVEALNAEAASSADGAPEYASVFLLTYPVNEKPAAGEEINVYVNNTVTSYADIKMESPYTDDAVQVKEQLESTTAPTLDTGSPASDQTVDKNTVVYLTVPDGASVYYTTDGSNPATSSTRKLYNAANGIIIDHSMTILAVAVQAGKANSEVLMLDYSVAGELPEGPTDPEIPVNPVSPGGSGDDDSYSVSVPASSSISGGSVTVSPRSAEKGDTVTITVKPDEGYELDTLTVTDSKGKEIELIDKGNNKYTFTMPGSSVKIQVSFKETELMTNPFADVYESDYYYDAVLWAVANGVTAGTSATTFSPNAPVTRAQMVTFLWRAHGSPKATGSNPFTDVSASDYYYDAVLWAVQNGVTSGTSATTFSPNAPVTRAQAMTFQWRAAGSPVVTGDSFDDVAADAYYAGAVTWAVANGITNGTGGNKFSPEVTVTRAQAVTFLWRELA